MIGLRVRLFAFLLSSLAIGSISATAQAEKVVTLGIDDFCPYTCLETNKPGFLVELVEIILNQSGFKLNVVRGSWTRIHKLGQENKVDLVGPITLHYAEKYKIPSTRELGGFFQAGFITQADAKWQFVDYGSLDKLNIAAVKDYSYPTEMEAHLNLARREQRYVELVGENANRRLVQMLASKRVDTVPMLSDVFFYQAMLLGLSAKNFKVAKVVPLPASLSTFRIGVLIKAPQANQAMIQTLDQGFATFKENGTFQKILLKYGIIER